MAETGRNEQCNCGSGKKYKNCCLVKQDFLGSNPESALAQCLFGFPNLEMAKKTILEILNFMKINDWTGACYATSAILFIFFSELGLKPVPCIGEVLCENKKNAFDHGWIEIDGKVFDLAAAHGLGGVSVAGIIVNNIDLSTFEPTKLEYGLATYEGLNDISKFILGQSIIEYLDASGNFGEPNIWDVVEMLAENVSLRFNKKEIYQKYKDVKWQYKTASKN